MKKNIFIKCLFIFSLFFLAKTSVFAEGFTCSALGDDVVIDEQLTKIVRYALIIIQLLVPILLVIYGTIDLLKGVASQKEDEIKKGQQVFIKRLISGALVFFVIAIVKAIISFAAGQNDGTNIMDCANCFLNGAYETTGECK